MADIDLKTATPDTSLPTTGFLFGADSQAAASPSVFTVQSVATTLLGSTTLTGATVTTSSPVIDAAQTWNAGAVTFTGLKFNATDTASASASLLMDLQVGGSSRFSVNKSGTIQFGPAANASQWVSQSNTNIMFNAAGSNRVQLGLGVKIGSGSIFQWSSTTDANDTGDLLLTRRAAANLRLGAADAAAPAAQTLSVQSVVAGTSNTAGANFTITGSQGTGTGAGGSIIFQVAPAGSSGTAQNALATALTIDSTRLATFAAGASFSGNVTATGSYFWFSSATSGVNIGNAGTINGVFVGQAAGIGFYSGAPSSSSPDTILARDAANTLALRNGTNAQTFNVYNTFTSSTNFERFRIFAQSAAAVLIGTEKGSGGGTARALELQTDATTRLTIGSGGGFTIADAQDIAVGSTTGTKIGTATTQKIGFYNAAPVVQPTAVADATDNATAITQLNALLSRMRDLGLIAT